MPPSQFLLLIRWVGLELQVLMHRVRLAVDANDYE